MRDRPALRPAPGTPTDQAWIESLFSHIKADWPQLDRIRDPEVLGAELAVVRHESNTVRLHAGIGYVTASDEHDGRGPRIRAARKRGLRHARWDRIIYHRYRKPKPTAGATPMRHNPLPDLCQTDLTWSTACLPEVGHRRARRRFLQPTNSRHEGLAARRAV